MAAWVTLGSWVLFSHVWMTHQEYREVHPYVSAFPIVAFLWLRNQPSVRCWSSASFEWLGTISLECYVRTGCLLLSFQLACTPSPLYIFAPFLFADRSIYPVVFR